MPTTILQKLGGILLGVLALLGAILLVQWGYNKVTTRNAALTGGMSAQEGEELKAPCTAAALPAQVSACGCPGDNGQMAGASRDDLFPGSYTTFGYSHVACEANPRNQRC